MKTRSCLLIFLAVALLLPCLQAADPSSVKKHWYGIWIASAGSTESFVGSSPLNPNELSAQIGMTVPIKLESLRSWDDDDKAWKSPDAVEGAAERGAAAVYILPRTILYFYEYPADPATLKSSDDSTTQEQSSSPDKPRPSSRKSRKIVGDVPFMQ